MTPMNVTLGHERLTFECHGDYCYLMSRDRPRYPVMVWAWDGAAWVRIDDI